jgi:hypothetical protein
MACDYRRLFIGLFVTVRDYTLQFTIIHIQLFTVMSSLAVAL